MFFFFVVLICPFGVCVCRSISVCVYITFIAIISLIRHRVSHPILFIQIETKSKKTKKRAGGQDIEKETLHGHNRNGQMHRSDGQL